MLNQRFAAPVHFTASGIVLLGQHVLLVHHKRLQAWVPPGGHVEETELPTETAIREVLEETGVAAEIISTSADNYSPAIAGLVEDPEAFFLAQPLFMQCVSARERGGLFYHLDVSYLCRPCQSGSQLPPVAANPELLAARWVHQTELKTLELAANAAEGIARAFACPMLAGEKV